METSFKKSIFSKKECEILKFKSDNRFLPSHTPIVVVNFEKSLSFPVYLTVKTAKSLCKTDPSYFSDVVFTSIEPLL